MPNSSTSSVNAWQTAPDRDFLAFELIRLAELHLNAYFADAAEIAAYRREPRRAASRVTAAACRLGTWERYGATFVLSALPAVETFQADLRGVGFSAALTLCYVPNDALLQAATVKHFSGDIPAALATATAWLEDKPVEEMMLKAALAKLEAGVSAVRRDVEDASRVDDIDPLDGPQFGPALKAPTPADAHKIKALTPIVAAGLRGQGRPSLDSLNNAWSLGNSCLENQPQTSWPLLDATVAASTARKRDEALVIASRWLLANQLELIRTWLERDPDWARTMLDAYQEKLIALAQAKILAEPDWLELLNLLKGAKLPIRLEMAEALTMADATPGEAPSPGEIA
jgi:hypothetical protein